jgi:hypothetical protein
MYTHAEFLFGIVGKKKLWITFACFSAYKYTSRPRRSLFTPGVLNLFQTRGHIHPFISDRGPQNYKRGQFIETPWQFIKIATKLGLPLQTDSHTTQRFSSTQVVIISISDTDLLE